MLQDQKPCTVGDLAKRLGIAAWKIRRIFEEGVLPEPPRAGRYRIFFPEDLPALVAALVRRGHVPEGIGNG